MARMPFSDAVKLAKKLHLFDLLRRRSVPAKRLRFFDAFEVCFPTVIARKKFSTI